MKKDTVTSSDLIYFFDKKSKSLPKDELWGHTSMLTEKEQERADQERQPLVVYAGTFQVDIDGEVIEWSNNSGHFKPQAKYANVSLRNLDFHGPNVT